MWLFRALSLNLQKKAQLFLGLSKDSIASHKKFEEKYGLTFTLLADPERKVIEAYDISERKEKLWKSIYGCGKKTYLIDEQGIIIKANDKVKAADDPENMLKELINKKIILSPAKKR